MGKNKEALLEQQTSRVENEEKFTEPHRFTNWGQIVDVFGKRAVIVYIDKVDEDTDWYYKVYYEEGGFDYINRDNLEEEMVKLEEFNNNKNK